MRRYVRRSLETKKQYIEADEFDCGVRNVFNYGHTFGHAIEAATDFAIPHGIAVTIGMDMANWIAVQLGVGSASQYNRMHQVLSKNYRGFEKFEIPFEAFNAAISSDKKNISDDVTLILPDKDAKIFRERYPNDDSFRAICAEYLLSY